MDDFAGTQAPIHRLADPAEAVAALESAVPGLVSLRLPEPRNVDWRLVEAGLGTALPEDFKLLREFYPTFGLGDFLGFGGPERGGEQTWVQGLRETLEDVEEWCSEADLTVPVRPFPAAGGLLPWAGSNQGDLFLWATNPAGPQEWTVTVASRSSAWWHYTGGAVQFLADLVTGAVEPWALPRVRPDVARW
ncbi:SMI1/KNR4 family protein [Kitasatospora sp. NPDC008115]|uniref:SMI1/KNR4 family protein n=1 Tax=Kitasatospora sp. NPDC008115 TaxID=3364022 RepID=UPI0036EFB8A2